MSFSAQVKEELNGINIKSNCCKKAFIFGVVIAAEECDREIILNLTDDKTVEKFCYYLKAIYKLEPQKSEIKRGCFKSTRLSFRSSKLSDFLSFADEFSSSDEDEELAQSFFGCESCKICFLRGVFCARGTISDPQKSYSLEIKAPNDTRAMLIHSIFEDTGLEAPGISPRKDAFGIFYRNESAIEDFLSVCGASNSMFEFCNAYIEKDFRNAENRATNCVAKNISKSVNAALAQVSAIEKLKTNGTFDELSADLKYTAELRLENPDLSLDDLASLHNPPISKSGLNHRLSKITDIANKIKLF